MELDVKKIVNAWITSFNPNEDEKKLAQDRYSICLSCEYRGKNIVSLEVCKKCGCPLSKKIFTNVDVKSKMTSCPLGKWDELDKKFKESKNQKYKLI
jgi:hypothetical protein